MKRQTSILIAVCFSFFGDARCADFSPSNPIRLAQKSRPFSNTTENADGKLNYCGDLIARGRYEEALDELNVLIAKYPKLRDAYILQSQAFDGLKQYPDALNSVERALNIGAPTIDELRVKAKYLALIGDYLASARIYDKIILHSPKDPRAYACRGACFFKLYGANDKAISDLEKCVELDPSDVKARRLLDGMKKSLGKAQ